MKILKTYLTELICLARLGFGWKTSDSSLAVQGVHILSHYYNPVWMVPAFHSLCQPGNRREPTSLNRY